MKPICVRKADAAAELVVVTVGKHTAYGEGHRAKGEFVMSLTESMVEVSK